MDTAAQSGLVASSALKRLQSTLDDLGLQIVWSDKRAQARGVGGEAKVVGVAQIPIGLGGISGILECTVVQEDIPLLLPIRLLRDLSVNIDFKTNILQVQKFGVSIPMETMSSGHATISIVDFGKGWVMPQDGEKAGLREDMFRAQGDRVLAAFGTSLVSAAAQRPALALDTNVFMVSRGEFIPRGGCVHVCGGIRDGSAELEARAEQGSQEDCCSRAASQRGGSLAVRWVCCWLIAATSLCTGEATQLLGSAHIGKLLEAYEQARVVCSTNSSRSVRWHPEVCQETTCPSGRVSPPDELFVRSGQCSAERGVVSGMPCTLESCHDRSSEAQGKANEELGGVSDANADPHEEARSFLEEPRSPEEDADPHRDEVLVRSSGQSSYGV